MTTTIDSTTTTSPSLPEGLSVGRYTIDPSHSEAGFAVKHAMISTVRGHFAIESGHIAITEDPTQSTTEAVLDMASVATRDKGRDEHLRSADFFDVESHPTMTYRSGSISVKDDHYRLEGELTIKGVTRPVSLRLEFEGAATDPFGNKRVGFTATTEINRKDFGLTWNAALETGGVLVSEKVKIELNISAIQDS